MGYKRAFFEDESVLAFFTDRHGGVSKGIYESLNISSNVGDDIRNIVQNRQIIAENNSFLLENIVYMKQIHSNNIQIIQNSFINEIKNVDGLITNKRKIPLMAMSADCAAVLIYDRSKKVISAIHSGRVGTQKEIVKIAIKKLINEYGSKSEDLAVEVGPSIGVCCYEISENLAKDFEKRYINTRDDRYYLDLKSMILDQLLSSGVKDDNIVVSDVCTSCDKNYFSYRRDGKTGRFCGIIMLK